MAKFDFHRLGGGVNSDDVVAQYLNYGPFQGFPIISPKPESFRIDPPGQTTVAFTGEGFKYNSSGDPTKGIIETMTVRADPGFEYLRFEVTGLNVNIATMRAAAATTNDPFDDIAFFQSIFDGKDTFIGTDFADKFFGLLGKDKLDGGEGDDTLDGGYGNDTLIGGYGDDELTGGKGEDYFLFDKSIRNGDNIDVITDFKPKDDTIRLDDENIFQGLGPKGTLKADMFVKGEVGGDNKDAGIIYDADGNLWFDVKGRAAAIFAHVDAGLKLTHEDFVIV